MPACDFFKLPEINTCCGCVKDLKTAAAIIAVLGIVTSPLISWAVVRHAYVIRVSCFVTTSSTRPDVVDINLSNVLTFGFGANAGLGPSCLIKNSSTVLRAQQLRAGEESEEAKHSQFVQTVRFVGWIVLVADFIFLLLSINFLFRMFGEGVANASRYFIIGGLISVVLSFIYGMLYISACVFMGGSFPIFEFVFALVDLIIWTSWLYFLLVIYAFSKPPPITLSGAQRLREYIMQNLPSGRCLAKITSKCNLKNLKNLFTLKSIGRLIRCRSIGRSRSTRSKSGRSTYSKSSERSNYSKRSERSNYSKSSDRSNYSKSSARSSYNKIGARPSYSQGNTRSIAQSSKSTTATRPPTNPPVKPPTKPPVNPSTKYDRRKAS